MLFVAKDEAGFLHGIQFQNLLDDNRQTIDRLSKIDGIDDQIYFWLRLKTAVIGQSELPTLNDFIVSGVQGCILYGIYFTLTLFWDIIHIWKYRKESSTSFKKWKNRFQSYVKIESRKSIVRSLFLFKESNNAARWSAEFRLSLALVMMGRWLITPGEYGIVLTRLWHLMIIRALESIDMTAFQGSYFTSCLAYFFPISFS